jgi:hypothetical protein
MFWLPGYPLAGGKLLFKEASQRTDGVVRLPAGARLNDGEDCLQSIFFGDLAEIVAISSPFWKKWLDSYQTDVHKLLGNPTYNHEIKT